MTRTRGWSWTARAATAGLSAALALALLPGAAEAQENGARRSHGGAENTPQPVVFSADEVTYDDELGVTIARGNVELTQAGRTLLADVVSYNQHSDTVTASGHVSMIEQATGETTFADFVELHDQMRDGFIKDVRMLLADRSRLAGNTARRTDANQTDIRKGVYSPCDLCKDDPTQPPIWQIKAARIIHNKLDQQLEYEDATLELDGWPLLWTPYLSQPDPTVKRRTGFLPATIGDGQVLGFNVNLPYFWAISEDTDLTVSPLFTTGQSTVMAGEYRERFANGQIDIIGSVTESNGNIATLGQPDDQVRGHIFANGVFDIDENLRAGFNIQHVSDLIYLEEYKFGGYRNFLNSSADLENFDGRDYGSVFAYDFQSLTPNVPDRTQPVVLPVAQYTWAGRPLDWGGRFTTTLGAIDIVRETGPGVERLSAGEEFDLPFGGPLGERFNFVAGLRTDGYAVFSQPLVPSGPLTDGVTGRVFPQLGLEWRDPWIRHDGTSTWIIEPMAAFYAAPVGGNPAKIPNTDSAAFDFNETDLFSRDRFAGYDQVDGGQRVDYAMHGAWYGSGTTNVDLLLGQSYRFQKSSPFTLDGAGDGLQYQTSDWVGRVAFNPAPILDLTYRFRLDERNLESRRQEVSTSFNLNPVSFSFNYLQLGTNVRDAETPRQQVGLWLNYKLDQYWTLNVNGTHDIAGDGRLLAAGFGAQYSDECMTMVATLSQDGTVIGNFKPGTTFLIQLVFKNLGEINLPALATGFGAS